MSDPSIVIRPATSNDLEIVVSFNVAMAEETEGKKLDPTVARAGAAAGIADPSRSLYFIAEVGGARAGQTMVTVEWSDWRNGFFWWIQSVYVDPGFRRRGVFRALYEHIREKAKRRKGVCGLRLYAHHDNKRAIETYRTLGMVKTEYVLLEEEWASV